MVQESLTPHFDLPQKPVDQPVFPAPVISKALIDSSGNERHGKIIGAVQFLPSPFGSAFGKAARLNGTASQGLSLPNLVLVSNLGFDIELKFNFATNPNGFALIWKVNQRYFSEEFIYVINAAGVGHVNWTEESGTTHGQDLTGFTFLPNTNYTLRCVQDGSHGVTFYVNGTKVDFLAIPQITSPSPSLVYIGCVDPQQAGFGNTIDGWIDEIKYNSSPKIHFNQTHYIVQSTPYNDNTNDALYHCEGDILYDFSTLTEQKKETDLLSLIKTDLDIENTINQNTNDLFNTIFNGLKDHGKFSNDGRLFGGVSFVNTTIPIGVGNNFGKCLKFIASNPSIPQHIQPHVVCETEGFSTGDLRVRMWVKLDAILSSGATLIKKGLGTRTNDEPEQNVDWFFEIFPDRTLGFSMSFDNLQAYTMTNTSQGDARTQNGDPSPLSLNQWHYIEFWYRDSDTQGSIYIDGNLTCTVNFTTALVGVVIGKRTNNPLGKLYIGGFPSSSGTNDFIGEIDDIHIESLVGATSNYGLTDCPHVLTNNTLAIYNCDGEPISILSTLEEQKKQLEVLNSIKDSADLLPAIENYLQEISLDTDKLDITLTALASLLKGSNSKDFSTLQTTLDAVLTQLQNNKDFEQTVWKDTNGTYYISRTVLNESTGLYVTTTLLVDGSPYTVVGSTSAQIPVGNNRDYEFEHVNYKANAGGTGYSLGDYILRSNLFDVSTGSPSLVATVWFNEVTGAIIATPTSGTIDPYNVPITISNAFALDATLLATNTLLGAINETMPTGDTVSSGINGRLQRIATNLTTFKNIFNFSSGDLLTKINQALPTGPNSIGQVTANAGLNLNTSALALEAGNLATIVLELGANTDAAVLGDNNGSLSAKLRGINKILNSVWDSGTNKLNIQGTVATTNPNLDSPISGLKSDLDAIYIRQGDGNQKTQVINFPASQAVTNINFDSPLSGIKGDLDAVLVKLDVALSTRASEATLLLIKTDLDNIYTRLDVALSTRAADATLQATNTLLTSSLSVLNSMLTQLQNDKDFEETIWIDKTTQVFYIRRATLTESSGAVVITWTDTAGTIVTPTVANLVQVASSLNLKITSTGFRATASGTGYSTGDRILEIVIVNTDNGTVASSLWINTTTNTVIAPPTLVNLKSEYEDALNIINASIQTTNAKIDILNTNFGTQADSVATTDIGTFSFLSLVKRQLQKLTSLIALFPVSLTGSGNFKVAIQEALPIGTNKIGGITIADGDDITQGTKADTPATNNTGSWTIASILKGIFGRQSDGSQKTQLVDSTDVNIGTAVNPIYVSQSVLDSFPVAQNITIVDSGTTPVTGFNGQAFTIGNPTAGSAATFNLSGAESVNIMILGVWTGTLKIEALGDNGVTWHNKFCRLPGTTYSGVTSVTANCFLIANVSGCTKIRIRASTTITGTAVVSISTSLNPHVFDVLNPIRLLDALTNTLMTIKAASSPSVLTDTAVVVSQRDPIPAGTHLIGQINANAGTNLNTSLLALESGNLATVVSEIGSNTDSATIGDTNGSLSSKLRGLGKIFNDVWDSTNHWFQVKVMNTVTITGTITSNRAPDATAAYASLNSDSAAYESNRIVKNSAGVLYGFTGYNSSLLYQFIHVYNSTTLPSNGTVPKVILRVAPQSNFNWDNGQFGKYFATGIVITNSSTGPTLTIGSADCWFNPSYE